MSEKDVFFEMVKKWTISDYHTQAIKSEVIIDMLISEFVEEMIASKIVDCSLNDVKLLAKEFPIDIGSSDLRNAKVDYLVYSKDTLYLVELKTTNDSYNKDQNERMKDVIKAGAGNALKFFFDIIDRKCNYPSKLDSKKYFYTLDKMVQKINEIDTKGNEKGNKQKLEKFFSNKKMDIIYIGLNELTDKQKTNYLDTKKEKYVDGENFIVLNKLDNNSKFKKMLSASKKNDNQDKEKSWAFVKEIIDEISKVFKQKCPEL